MKKLLVIFLLILSIPLYSEVVFDQSFDLSSMNIIKKAIDENDKGHDDVVFSLSSFEKEEKDKGKFLYSFNLSFLDNSFDIKVLSDEKSIKKDLTREIYNALFYEESLYSDSSETIDYIYSGSFSFIPEENYRRGQTFISYDERGKKTGVFELNRHYKDVESLQPVYIKNARPGNELRKASSFRYSLQGATNFYKGAFSFSAELMNTSWIYPFSPSVSVFYEQRAGRKGVYFGIGLSAFFDLNDIFSTGFTLIEEGRIGANATFLLGALDGEFAYNGAYSIFYEHRLLPKFYWRVGYAYYPMMKSSLVLGIGGSF